MVQVILVLVLLGLMIGIYFYVKNKKNTTTTTTTVFKPTTTKPKDEIYLSYGSKSKDESCLNGEQNLYYIDTDSFLSANKLYSTIEKNFPAKTGFYCDGHIVRQWSSKKNEFLANFQCSVKPN